MGAAVRVMAFHEAGQPLRSNGEGRRRFARWTQAFLAGLTIGAFLVLAYIALSKGSTESPDLLLGLLGVLNVVVLVATILEVAAWVGRLAGGGLPSVHTVAKGLVAHPPPCARSGTRRWTVGPRSIESRTIPTVHGGGGIV